MTALPAAGYVSDAARTVGEKKTAEEDIVAFIRERTGSGVGWVALTGGGTVNLGAQTGRMYSLTGGPAVTSFGTMPPGDSFPYMLKMAAASTFTRSASLKVEGLAADGAILSLEIDDIISVWWEGSNVWRVVVVSRASGLPTTSTTGFKNRVINGDFRIDQRNAGASITITAGAALAYGLDRWYLACAGANATAQQTLTGGRFRLLCSGASSVTSFTVGHRIERLNSIDMAGGLASLSLTLQAVGSLTTVNYAIYYANSNDSFGTIASPTRTSITSGSFTVTPTETKFTVPNIAIPGGATTGIEIVFSTGALGAGNGFYLGDVQLESGAFVSPFERRHIQFELELCQRYYERAPATSSFGFACPSTGGFAHIFNWHWKVRKRSVPVVTPTRTGDSNVDSASVNSNAVDLFTYQVVGSTSTNTTFNLQPVGDAEL